MEGDEIHEVLYLINLDPVFPFSLPSFFGGYLLKKSIYLFA
jgi:hypothetical protein